MKGINKPLSEAKKFIIVYGEDAPDAINRTVYYYFKEKDFKNAKFYETVYHLAWVLQLSKMTEYDYAKKLLFNEWKRAIRTFRQHLLYKYEWSDN